MKLLKLLFILLLMPWNSYPREPKGCLSMAQNRIVEGQKVVQCYLSQDPIGLAGNNPTFYGYVYDSNTETDPFGLAGVPWLPHGATQPDVVSKGPHFYAGDGKTELKLALDGDKVTFVEAFGKDSNTPALKKAIKESEEKLLNDKSWREKLLKNAREVKISLFENFGRLDRARDVKKIEKALKKMCN